MSEYKEVLLWVGLSPFEHSGIFADLMFTSEDKFKELLNRDMNENDQLVKIKVPIDFDNLDFIPDNY